MDTDSNPPLGNGDFLPGYKAARTDCSPPSSAEIISGVITRHGVVLTHKDIFVYALRIRVRPDWEASEQQKKIEHMFC
jgi:hypothetical protein